MTEDDKNVRRPSLKIAEIMYGAGRHLFWPRTRYHKIAGRAMYFHKADQEPGELGEFLRVLDLNRCRTILEVGTRNGGSARAFSRIIPFVITIDINPCPRSLPKNVHQIVADSHDKFTPLEVRHRLRGLPVDALFIDGDHSFSGTKQDHDLYSPLVRQGGIVAMHDIVNECEPESRRFWESLNGTDTRIEIVLSRGQTHRTRAGIGYYYKET